MMMWLLFEKLVEEVFKIAAWLTDHSSRELRELSGMVQLEAGLNRDTQVKQLSGSIELEAVLLLVGLNRDMGDRRTLVVQLVVH